MGKRHIGLLTRDDPISGVALEYLRENTDPMAKRGLFTVLWSDRTEQATEAVFVLANLTDETVPSPLDRL